MQGDRGALRRFRDGLARPVLERASTKNFVLSRQKGEPAAQSAATQGKKGEGLLRIRKNSAGGRNYFGGRRRIRWRAARKTNRILLAEAERLERDAAVNEERIALQACRNGTSAVRRGVKNTRPEFLSAEECLAHAETCEHAARFLSGPDELQRVLLEIAALWRKRARVAAARSKA
jgi:hypothetical protein